jgi:peptidoglycan-N-acetylmuramic acid deacetylase
MHHPDMAKIADFSAFEKELTALQTLFQEITGQELPKYYRPPQGNYSESNLQMAKELGYKTVFWSLAYVDWNNDAQPDPQSSKEKLLARTHDGMVLLLHSTSQTNAQILEDLLTHWTQMGYCFAPISELFS